MDARSLSPKTSRTRRIHPALIVLLVGLAGCLDPAPKLIDEPAPNYFLQDTNGKTHYREQHEGSPVILDFFSTWCLACRDQFRELVELNASTNVTILSVGSDPLETDLELDIFAAKYGANWPIARDTTSLTSKVGIRSLPGIIVIDADGAIRYRHEGTAIGAATLEDVLARVSSA